MCYFVPNAWGSVQSPRRARGRSIWLHNPARSPSGWHPADDIDPHGRARYLERRGHGLYRLHYLPVTPLDAYMEATLWPRGARGVLSHESALDLYELSDVNPSKIHFTVPRAHRIRREIPALYRVHHEAIADEDVT